MKLPKKLENILRLTKNRKDVSFGAWLRFYIKDKEVGYLETESIDDWIDITRSLKRKYIKKYGVDIIFNELPCNCTDTIFYLKGTGLRYHGCSESRILTCYKSRYCELENRKDCILARIYESDNPKFREK